VKAGRGPEELDRRARSTAEGQADRQHVPGGRASSARSASRGARTRRCNIARDLREKTDILLTRAPRESLLQSGERVISVGEIDSQVRAWIAEGLPFAVRRAGAGDRRPVRCERHGQGAEPERRAADGRLPGVRSTARRRARRRRIRATMGRPRPTTSRSGCTQAATQVVHDTVQIMAAKEALYPKAAAILTGQAK
jgi:hypothetical protein